VDENQNLFFGKHKKLIMQQLFV